MVTVILVLLGLFIGGVIDGKEGLVSGFFVGLAFGMITSLKSRVMKLERELAWVMKRVNNQQDNKEPVTEVEKVEDVPAPLYSPRNGSTSQMPADDFLAQLNLDQNSLETKAEKLDMGTAPPDDANWQENKEETRLSKPDFAQKAFFTLRDFFTKGNVVVKVGAIVLFFGVAFLLKYAADRSLFPIELRLMGVVFAGVAMLFVGWRLRGHKLEYGLVLQGAGLGLLYITVFSASKLYHLLPISLSLVIMLLLVVLTGVLAIKQNAKSLAIFGVTGGFIAPVLMSTGSGSHIVLFSYYALLNLGIFGIAWFKSWRFLNLVGFIFTFAISSAWGVKSYQPEYFVSTEFFLILFYFFYLAISVLFALRQAPKLKGYVDGTLVFGLPLIAFALQSQLVEQFEYGQAITAVSMAGIYFILAKVLWLPEKKGLRLLSESFLAVGVVFASLAIPLYFDGRWTAAIWSLEGAALVWIGLKQSHFIPRAFGLLLSVGAGLAFIESIEGRIQGSMAIINSAYIGMVLVSLSAFFIAYLYEKNKEKAYSFELKIAVMMILWGLLWWFYSGFIEINRYLSQGYELKVFALFISLTTFAQIAAHRKFSWPQISLTSFLFAPAIVILMIILFLLGSYFSPLSYLGYIAWPVVLFVHLLVLKRKERCWSKWMLTTWHAAGVVGVAFIVTKTIQYWVENTSNLSYTWVNSSVGITLALCVWGLLKWGNKAPWPITRFSRAYYSLGLLPVVSILFLWNFFSSGKAGTPWLFHYIPVLNPLDLAQGLAIGVMVYWLWFINKYIENKWLSIHPVSIALTAGIMSFAWVNVVIARTVHAFSGVNYSDYSMMKSSVFQTSTSIVWSVIAMVLMALALKKTSRYFWYAGASLLALVVLKLFFIDLAESGSISRIVSFLVVGALMLVIGYLSPLPPKRES